MSASITPEEQGAAATGLLGSALGSKEFAFLSDFVYKHCGIVLGEHKRQLVQGLFAAPSARTAPE